MVRALAQLDVPPYGRGAECGLYLTTFFFWASDMMGQFGTLGATPLPSDAPKLNRRLDSWKEIAAFFGRDERTVKRWEKERSLPVHRLPGGSRGRVFAFTEELDRWMHSPESLSVSAGSELPRAVSNSVSPFDDGSSGPPEIVTEATEATAKRDRWFWILASFCALLLIGSVIGWRYHSGRPASIEAPVKASTQINPEAEDLYLKGRYYWSRRTPADLTRAVDYFTQAIVRDPSYAQPYVGLADCYNLLREFAAMPNEEAFPRALAAAKKAVELDNNSAEAHASLAFDTFYWSWDVAGAEAEFRRAIQLNPQYVAAHHWYATFLLSRGRFDEATKEFETAQRLDPASTAILADKALLLFDEGQVDDAELLLKQIVASQPGLSSSHGYLAGVYLARHDYPKYLGEVRQAAELSHDEHQMAIVRTAEQGFRARGERGLLENKLALQEKLCAEGQVSPYAVAETAALSGRKNEALQYLRQAYQRHDVPFLVAGVDYWLVSLRGEPEFQKLLADAGLAPITHTN